MQAMYASLLSLLILSASLDVQSAVYACVDDQGNTYYREGGCKIGDQPASRVNVTGTPMVPRAQQAPMAPQVPSAPPPRAPQVPVK